MNKEAPVTDAIAVEKIAVLKYLPKETIGVIRSHFSTVDVSGEQILIGTGETVEFLYLVFSVKNVVYADILCSEYLTTLGPGDTIGEMSLIEESRSSSATLRCGAGGAKLGLITFNDFKRIVMDQAQVAYGFFRGVSELLSGRLRETNKRAKTSLSIAIKVLRDIIDQYEKSSGSGMRLENLIPQLTNAAEMPPSKLDSALLISIRDVIENAAQTTPGNLTAFFDHLDIILQFLQNVSRVMNGKEVRSIQAKSVMP
jgi:CRP-like cAMP-binding protein